MFSDWNDDSRFLSRSLWYPVSFAGGAALYYSLNFEPGLPLYFIFFLAIGLLMNVVVKIPGDVRPAAQFSLLILVWFCAGFMYAAARTHLISAEPLTRSYDKVMVEGWIERVESSSDQSRLTLLVHAISDLSSENVPRRVRLSQRSASDLSAGRFVRCFASVNPPPEPDIAGDYEFHRESYFKGLGGVGFVYGRCEPGALPVQPGLFVKMNSGLSNLRQNIARHVYDEAGEGGGLAAALLTGDRSYLTDSEQDVLRATGLAHLLAISGLHMGLAGGAFYFLFFRLLCLVEPLAKRWPMQKPAALAALMAVTGYLLLSGMGISAQRAYVMVAVGFLAILMDRPVLSLQTIGLSMVIVILVTPSAVVTPGFQMSFAAAAALIKAYSASFQTSSVLKKGFVSRHVVPILLTSIIAGLATMPFAIFHFGRAAPLGIVANFVVMPIFTVISVPLAVLSAFSMTIGLGDLPLHWFGQSLQWIMGIASWFAYHSPKGQSLFLERPMGVSSLLACSLAMIFWILSAKSYPKRSLVLMSMAGMIWFMTPKSAVIVSTKGYLAVQTDTGWTSVHYDRLGLKPLAFSELETRKCLKGCSLNLNDGSTLTVSSSGLEIEGHTGELETFSFRSHAWSIAKGTDNPRHIGYTACRPWTSTWPKCHT